MRLRYNLLTVLIVLFAVIGTTAFAVPTYRSMIEWNGPYFHVRHGLNADSSAYLDYTVNNPLPLYSSPFSSPTAVETYGTITLPSIFVVDHDHRRIQVFTVPSNWKVETLYYSATPIQGNFGGNSIKFTLGQVVPSSERIAVNGQFLTRVSSLASYGVADSVYTIVNDGVPNTGGVVTLPIGWTLDVTDSVRVEYAYCTPPGLPGQFDLDYVLTQNTPTDIPLQLNESTSALDPAMTDLTSIAVNPSVRPLILADIYLVNGLAGGLGTLASYELDALGLTGTFDFVDTYPGLLGRPYDVEIVDNGANTAGTMGFAGTSVGVADARMSTSITNQNAFLGHDYQVAFVFDTCSAMNQVTAADNNSVDVVYNPVTGRLHMVFCRDDTPAQGTAYSYSDDYGQTWSTAVTISPSTLLLDQRRPRVALLSNGEIHVVWEAQDATPEWQLWHTYSSDGVSWSTPTDLTTVYAAVTDNRYPNLLASPADQLFLVWAADDDVYYQVYSGTWSPGALVASGAGTGFSAPHCVMDGVGRVYCAYVSDAGTPSAISYMHYNGATWGSFETGGFTAGTPDPVTNNAGFAGIGASTKGLTYPMPQVVMTGDSIWVFWNGDGTNVYGTNQARIYYQLITDVDGNFAVGAGTPIVPATDDVAPMAFTAVSDGFGNIHIVYPFATTEDQEGLRYKKYTESSGVWFPVVGSVGREIYAADVNATTFAQEPRLTVPTINNASAPFLACCKGYTAPVYGAGSPRALFKVIDGVIKVTDHTTLSEINQWAVWTHASADTRTLPGMSFTISNTSEAISNTDDVDATEFNVGDYFELNGTEGVTNDRLFLTDSDYHRFKVIRAYDNVDNCFAGGERWDVPGQSDGTPGQTYKLATIGGEGTYRVWGGHDSTAWTIVDDMLITGPTDRVCEVDRYTREVRFGDNVHGLIPPTGAYIRVNYEESVDEAEYGSLGTGTGQFSLPRGIAVNYNINLGHYDVYICDTGNDRLQKLSYDPNSSVNPDSWTNAVVDWNTAASDTDLVVNPEDIEVVMLNGSVYLVVSERGNHRLLIYRDDAATGSGGNEAPVFVSSIGQQGLMVNQFMNPRGMSLMAEDSGLVIYAADADRNNVAKILRRDWLKSSAEDTATGGSQQDNTLRVRMVDALDNDAYLLLQPGAVRTIRVEIVRSDSLVSVLADGTFAADIIDIVSINEGNLWNGESYTNEVFLADWDNAAGTFEINTSMVGDADGLSSPPARVMATIVVRADSSMPVPASGLMSFATTTDLRTVSNTPVMQMLLNDLNLAGGYLADIASTGGSPGAPPSMKPQPDGMVDFADVNVFTQGWNGDGLTFDPIADIGPWTPHDGTVPNLIADPDGQMDAWDLLSLSTMYGWYHPAGALLMAPPGIRSGSSGLDAGSPVVASAHATETGWSIELQARDVTDLTTAHLYLEFGNASVLNVRAGDFLGSSGELLFLSSVNANRADISMGRLNRQDPAVDGSGVLATVDLALPGTIRPEVRLVYELRSSGNGLIGAADVSDVPIEEVPTEFGLDAPYPNPFNSTTTFTLHLSKASQVKFSLYNVLGQEVAVITQRSLPAGTHRISWDAREAGGVPLTTGMYFARLEAPGNTAVRKVMLLR